MIRKEGLEFLNWSKKAISLKDKINFINSTNNFKDNFPNFSDSWLLDNLEDWLGSYLEGIKDIAKLKNLNIYNILLDQLSWQTQQELKELLPNSIKVPSGSTIYIDYSNIETPKLEVRLQEIFGLMDTPKILNNTIELQINLLSPASKPIAITYDLRSFWSNGYKDVRRDLRGKYKRHYWPEDPFTAIATSKTKKHMNS